LYFKIIKFGNSYHIGSSFASDLYETRRWFNGVKVWLSVAEGEYEEVGDAVTERKLLFVIEHVSDGSSCWIVHCNASVDGHDPCPAVDWPHLSGAREGRVSWRGSAHVAHFEIVAVHFQRVGARENKRRACDEVVARDQYRLHGVLQRALAERLSEELLRLGLGPEHATEDPGPAGDPAAVVGEEPQRLLGGEQRLAILSACEEQSDEDTTDTGASGSVEEIGNSRVRVAGLTAKAGLEVREGLRGEDAVGGAGAVNAEDPDFSGGVFCWFHVSCVWNGIGAILGVAVAEEEIVFENGKDFVGELVNLEVRVNHVEVHWRCGHCRHFCNWSEVFVRERKRKRFWREFVFWVGVVVEELWWRRKVWKVGIYSEEWEWVNVTIEEHSTSLWWAINRHAICVFVFLSSFSQFNIAWELFLRCMLLLKKIVVIQQTTNVMFVRQN